MPARPVRTLWDRGIDLPLEPFTGRLDVVHGTNYVVPPTIRAAQVVSVYDLTTVHFPEMCEPATLAFPRLVRRAVERGAWVHTMSEVVAAEVVEEFGADPTRVRVVLPGVPPLDPHLSRSPGAVGPEPVAEPEVGPFGRYVLAIGTVEPRKDYPGLVQAFEKVAGGRPDLGLVICGRDGWGAEEFRRAWEASPVRDRIVRPGYLDDRSLARLLRGAALLAYPSRYEGFGLPPLQAMADGVPVVATAAGSVPEVVGDAALVVEPGDTDGLAGAMERVLDDPGLAASLSRAGVERAGAFSWERCASGMADLYRDAAGA
jgi:glycosyltransferase involved in cell wall biosynthesis